MRPPRVPLGIGPPNVLQQTITADTTTPTLTDLTLVTLVTLKVAVPGQTGAQTWAASILSATAPVGGIPSSLVWQYAFTGAETPVTGVYTVTPTLTVPGGVVPCDPVTFLVTTITGGA